MQRGAALSVCANSLPACSCACRCMPCCSCPAQQPLLPPCSLPSAPASAGVPAGLPGGNRPECHAGWLGQPPLCRQQQLVPPAPGVQGREAVTAGALAVAGDAGIQGSSQSQLLNLEKEASETAKPFNCLCLPCCHRCLLPLPCRACQCWPPTTTVPCSTTPTSCTASASAWPHQRRYAPP